jgi:CRP-like cAMP-binding protein
VSLPHFYNFKTFLSSVGLTDNEIELLVEYCEIVHFKKGDLIFKVDEKKDCIYYINKGIVRYYLDILDGSPVTYNFRIENMLVTSYIVQNAKDGFKSKFNCECLDECELVKIPLTALLFIEESTIQSHRVARNIADIHLLEMVDFIIENDTKTLIEKYYLLESKFPNIHQRVSQSVIASYLRTSPVHLSRIKSSNR